MSKKAIEKLVAHSKNYDVNVEVVAGPQGTVTVKALVQTFNHTEKGPQVARKASAYGSGQTLLEAQNKAISAAVSNLGL